MKGSKLSNVIVEKFEDNYLNAFRLRKKLIDNKIVLDSIFQEDYEFDSISLAASIILGRNAIGQREWVDEDGIPYDEKIDVSGIAKEFKINDESTYFSLKVGTLAYELFKNIFDLGNISADEITKLKKKEYSNQLFSKTDYPILAGNRDDNMVNSNVIRYRKDPIIFNGKSIYITTQWFEENRNDLISWYRKHL